LVRRQKAIAPSLEIIYGIDFRGIFTALFEAGKRTTAQLMQACKDAEQENNSAGGFPRAHHGFVGRDGRNLYENLGIVELRL
jgi:hypothetical protein